MRNKRRCYISRRKANKRNRAYEIIENHIKSNVKLYAIAIITFVIGVVIGVIWVNNSSASNKEEIIGYIQNFIETIKSRAYKIDGRKALTKSIIQNAKFSVIIWCSGLTIIGIPIIIISVLYKGFRVGYSIAAIIATLDMPKGIIFAVSTLLIQNLLTVPCMLALMVSSLKMCKSVLKCYNKKDLKFEIYRHTFFSLIMTIGMIISSILELCFTNAFFSDIIINFV